MVVLKGLTGLKHRRLHYLENDLHGRRKWVFRLYSAQKCFARGMVIGDRKKPSTKKKYILIFFFAGFFPLCTFFLELRLNKQQLRFSKLYTHLELVHFLLRV